MSFVLGLWKIPARQSGEQWSRQKYMGLHAPTQPHTLTGYVPYAHPYPQPAEEGDHLVLNLLLGSDLGRVSTLSLSLWRVSTNSYLEALI